MSADRTEAPGLPGVRLLLRRARWVVLAAVLGLAAGATLDLVRTPVYESTAYLAVTTERSQDTGAMARSAQALARLATSPGIVSAPLRVAGLPDAAADPRGFITVQAAPDAPVISVTGRSSDAEAAQRIAESVSFTLVGLDAVEPFDAVVVGEPAVPDDPTMPWWVVPFGGAAGAAGLGLVLAATLPHDGGTRDRPRPRLRLGRRRGAA
ncbi:Wzz/FepE/Etk N-terminal domain-containing protein [Blastococcus sp. TF02A_35]|uniref:Wzz/FepE/Etk N-terminal domain-containing protein n=1 Tax=Blastococcus sp. TF02A-35 TaxID=2559612 RepID=UPI00142FD887|nr:Wzz/FepE/Etk N-terminal domain-containing protein [Blastococcus sp. TF02A_35]